jgi:hypothetical protein
MALDCGVSTPLWLSLALPFAREKREPERR